MGLGETAQHHDGLVGLLGIGREGGHLRKLVCFGLIWFSSVIDLREGH